MTGAASVLVFIVLMKNISQAHKNTIVEFYPGVFQGIVFILREAIVKECDS
jgi:uncharacterized membrane protein (DUF373 family)